jgi:DNA polymerase III epsilon subunit-like protein
MDFSGSANFQSLDTAGKRCGISLPNSHRACDDTLLAREVFMYIAGGIA